ncbi:MAG: DNA replication/repair protein RecF [Piscirickettsiaceae bacterium]|nr:MAG: DNA replication/repair protein RecF [Piscirickettsiaceae bacterium]PCI71758.1 MAG: DNA replication/repair protein RecF [Piscirickettsiaceae bacterium]
MLSEVKISNIRNIKSAHLKLSGDINIFVGPNGSGKTSILEGIYLLSRSRSFRTQSLNKVRTKNEEALVVYGLLDDGKTKHQIAIKKTNQETKIKINGKSEKKASELTEYFKVHLIRPESQTLLERGSSVRRAFVDWGVFHVKHQFLDNAKKYNHTLKQRNKLLKHRDESTLPIWSRKLAEYGTIVNADREGYLELLARALDETIKPLLGDMDIQLSYTCGWQAEVTLEQALNASVKKDLLKGYTTVGPHRSDITLRVDGHLAQDYLSRGQMKLAVMALCLAQAKVSARVNNQNICVLIDDLSAELDGVNLGKVLKLLYDTGAQILVTTTDRFAFKDWLKLEKTKLFHVEQGLITEGA